MKAAHLLLPAIVLALSLTACGDSQPDTTESDTGNTVTTGNSQSRPSLESITPKNPAAKLLPKESGEDPRFFPCSYELEADSPTEAYSKVLWYIFQYGCSPGEDGPPDYDYSKRADNNNFAIYDIDQDGRDELLFDWCYAAYVWEHKDRVLHEELVAFPDGLIFYDNGAVYENWSHNQGGRTCENFWPYSLHIYNAETDIYTDIGDVNAWDINHSSAYFPTDIDQDGDGIVYLLHRAGEDRYTGSYDEYGNPIEEPPVDGLTYEAWRDSILQDSQPVEIPWLPLTRENISALGYPEPEMPDWMSYLEG